MSYIAGAFFGILGMVVSGYAFRHPPHVEDGAFYLGCVLMIVGKALLPEVEAIGE